MVVGEESIELSVLPDVVVSVDADAVGLVSDEFDPSVVELVSVELSVEPVSTVVDISVDELISRKRTDNAFDTG